MPATNPSSTAGQSALDLLQHTYGYRAFRGQQQAIIDAACAGLDTLVLMPTGGGKSLCYQIPALLREGTGIVISPLIALMQDQVDALRQLGLRAAFLNSTLGNTEQYAIQQQMQNGELDLLYVAPERINQPATQLWLSACDISLIAIDEAHCVSQWGHDFRQDYLRLHELQQHFAGVPRMALTATATQATREEIAQRLELASPQTFTSSFDRPNIHYTVAEKADGKKQLLRFLTPHRDASGIVYCLSRKRVEATADYLNQQGLNALPYHAGLGAAQRAENQARFLREDSIIMVATVAFGMGIDKPDVRFVVHMNLPKSMEAYYQETGRAGRDGESAQAYMIYGLDDVVQLAQFIDNSDAANAYKYNEKQKLDTLLGWCEHTGCRRQPLLAYFGETLDQPCDNCDNCNKPPQTWNATEAAQKLLSCVYRLQQRFGAMHTIDVLRGKQSEKVEQFGHQNLSTFGIGSELSQNQWRSLVRQLIVRGYLQVNQQQYGALALTEASRDVLKGEVTLELRKIAAVAKQKPAKPARPNQVSAEDETLWHALRDCRKQLADQHDIPPYMIFHDATLMQMMELHPSSEAELLQLSGVG
ncbi:MAG: DNA helicase RecQ, partial [Pseudomonadales bacterium]|nr:DNA helicase RecQ [Pseudomonadales bacterium]